MSRSLSLLEVMVALVLLLMAAGAIGWKMFGFIEKKRFQTDLARFKSQLQTVHNMAINMQSDWSGVLTSDGKRWTFQATCLEPLKTHSPPPIQLSVPLEVRLNGANLESLTVSFFSSGVVWPRGQLYFRQLKGKETVRWELPKMFGEEEGDGMKKLGPIHPSEA